MGPILSSEQRAILLFFYNDTDKFHDLLQDHKVKALYVILALCNYFQETGTTLPGLDSRSLWDVIIETKDELYAIDLATRDEILDHFYLHGPHPWHCTPADKIFYRLYGNLR